MKPRKTLTQMAGREPLQIAGMPADVCPYCGAATFVDGVNRTAHEITRYIECRNANCRKRFLTYQPPAKLVRELNSADGKPALSVVRNVG